MQLANVVSQLLHLLLLDHEILPVEHLNLRLVFALLEQGKKVADFLENPVLLHNNVVLLLRELRGRMGAHLQHAALCAMRVEARQVAGAILRQQHLLSTNHELLVKGPVDREIDALRSRCRHTGLDLVPSALAPQRVQVLLKLVEHRLHPSVLLANKLDGRLGLLEASQNGSDL